MKRFCSAATMHIQAGVLRAMSIAFVVCFVFTTANAAPSKTSDGIDVVLVLDASGSMRKSDPLRMRVQAAKMFVTLLDRRDRVALISFSGTAQRDTELLSLSTVTNENKVVNAIDNITETGTKTNLHDALRESFALLKKVKQKNRDQMVILMSDGKMDVGAHNRDLKLLEKTIDELVPEFQKNNIKIHSIAFTENSYVPLLKIAADDTHGRFHFLKNAEAIHQIFESIFEQSKQPEMLPLSQDSFIVDPDVNEITVVASKFKPDSFIALANPSGVDYDQTTNLPNLRWFSGKQFDFITIEKPLPGYWVVKFSEGGNKAYVITDLKLKAELSTAKAEPNEPLDLQVQLTRHGKPVVEQEILTRTKISATLIRPDGKRRPIALHKSHPGGNAKTRGMRRANLQFEIPGQYRIDVVATGDTFDRKKTVFLEIAGVPPKDPFAVRDENRQPEPVAKSEPGPTSTPEQSEPNSKEMIPAETTSTEATPAATADETTHPIANDSVETPVPVETEKPVDTTTEVTAEQNQPEHEKKNIIVPAVIGLIGLNIVLFSVGFIIYWRKKNQFTMPETGIDLSKDIDELPPDIIEDTPIENPETIEMPPTDESQQTVQ